MTEQQASDIFIFNNNIFFSDLFLHILPVLPVDFLRCVVISLAVSNTVVATCATCFNNQNLLILSKKPHLYISRVIIRIGFKYHSKQIQSDGLYDGDAVCFL
jgi:hypothetical protein